MLESEFGSFRRLAFPSSRKLVMLSAVFDPGFEVVIDDSNILRWEIKYAALLASPDTWLLLGDL